LNIAVNNPSCQIEREEAISQENYVVAFAGEINSRIVVLVNDVPNAILAGLCKCPSYIECQDETFESILAEYEDDDNFWKHDDEGERHIFHVNFTTGFWVIIPLPETCVAVSVESK
jgi:hypothetical protein